MVHVYVCVLRISQYSNNMLQTKKSKLCRTYDEIFLYLIGLAAPFSSLSFLFLSCILFLLPSPLPPPPQVTSTLICFPNSLLRWNFKAFCITSLLPSSTKPHPLDLPVSRWVSKRKSDIGTPLLLKCKITSSPDNSFGKFPRNKMNLLLLTAFPFTDVTVDVSCLPLRSQIPSLLSPSPLLLLLDSVSGLHSDFLLGALDLTALTSSSSDSDSVSLFSKHCVTISSGNLDMKPRFVTTLDCSLTSSLLFFFFPLKIAVLFLLETLLDARSASGGML